MPLVWHLASGGQWLGIDWAPWRGWGGGFTSPSPHAIPGAGGGVLLRVLFWQISIPQ